MIIKKNGVITSSNIFESSAKNYLHESYIGKSYQYTPTTANNSTIPGYIVDFSNCIQGEKIYINIKIEWSGFDTSNTAGTFSLYFQGSTYNVTNGWEWAGTNSVTSALGNITSIVLQSTSGSTTIKRSATLHSDYPSVRSKAYVGLRSNYSNGTGWIRISDLEVIPERFYIPGNAGIALHDGKDLISSREIIEF